MTTTSNCDGELSASMLLWIDIIRKVPSQCSFEENEKLQGDVNFPRWQRAMKRQMVGRCLDMFVDGSWRTYLPVLWSLTDEEAEYEIAEYEKAAEMALDTVLRKSIGDPVILDIYDEAKVVGRAGYEFLKKNYGTLSAETHLSLIEAFRNEDHSHKSVHELFETTMDLPPQYFLGLCGEEKCIAFALEFNIEPIYAILRNQMIYHSPLDWLTFYHTLQRKYCPESSNSLPFDGMIDTGKVKGDRCPKCRGYGHSLSICPSRHFYNNKGYIIRRVLASSNGKVKRRRNF